MILIDQFLLYSIRDLNSNPSFKWMLYALFIIYNKIRISKVRKFMKRETLLLWYIWYHKLFVHIRSIKSTNYSWFCTHVRGTRPPNQPTKTSHFDQYTCAARPPLFYPCGNAPNTVCPIILNCSNIKINPRQSLNFK